MDISINKADILDLLVDKNALRMGLVEILVPTQTGFSREIKHKENHTMYLGKIEGALRQKQCIRVHRPELITKKFKNLQEELDGVVTTITLHPKGFNIKWDYCKWFNFHEFVISGRKELMIDGKVVQLSSGDDLLIETFEGAIVPSSKALEDTVTYSVYKNRLLHEGPIYGLDLEEHPFFQR